MVNNNTPIESVDDLDLDDEATRARIGLPSRQNVDVPDDLQFTSYSGEERDPERIPCKIDDQVFTLTQPPNTALYLLGNNLMSPDAGTQLDAMMKLVNLCLDQAGVNYLWSRIFDPQNTFADGLIGDVVATIMSRWAEKTVAETFVAQQKVAVGSRSERRAAAKKAPAKKAAPRTRK